MSQVSTPNSDRPASVLHVASEQHPFVKTGGLADVLGALPSAQRELGQDARVLLPGFPGVLDAGRGLTSVWTEPDLFGGGPARLFRGSLEGSGVSTYVLDCPGHFSRVGDPYTAPGGNEWPDNASRFGALGWVGALLGGGLDPQFPSPLIHAHDWQAAMSVVYARVKCRAATSAPAVMTIHNLAYSGSFDPRQLESLHLPSSAMQTDGVEFYGRLSFLKGGLFYADRITTVSPTYAKEIQGEDQGAGFEGLLRSRSSDLVGIMNGVDYQRWSPERDPFIPQGYDADRLQGKGEATHALRERLGFSRTGEGPLFGLVSRLVWQKGVDLVIGALPRLRSWGAQLVVLGSGDASLESELKRLASRHPEQLRVVIDHDEALSHLIQAGSDSILVPSRSEPCGLTQLYALSYGSPPVVRRTGGLADSVTDATTATRKDRTATGFVFGEASVEGLEAALARAVRAFADRPGWRELQRAGMQKRFDWRASAQQYTEVYAAARSGPSPFAAANQPRPPEAEEV